jgi:Luciferase-like monooxygenase/Acetyltransferase (GNAT) family
MWTQEEPTYHGKYFKIDKAYCDPKPVQRPYPPIVIDGGGRRILEIAANEADVLNLNPPVTKGFVDIVEALRFDRTKVLKRIEMMRGKGYATKLMNAIEQMAAQRGCVNSYIDTFSFQARPLYEKLGYKVFGTTENHPKGHSHYFLKKTL